LENVKTIFHNKYSFVALKKNNTLVSWGLENWGGNVSKRIEGYKWPFIPTSKILTISGDRVEGKSYVMILKEPEVGSFLVEYNVGGLAFWGLRGDKILSYGMTDDLDSMKPDSLVITNKGKIMSFNRARKARGVGVFGEYVTKKVALGIQVITTSL
jgi:hypothetical protein